MTERSFSWPSRPLVMAVVNATPDSFSGQVSNPVHAALEALAAGADIIDIGGESTRPGAVPITASEEQRRILPVIEAMAGRGALLSVDTRYAATMRAALAAGADIINDVSGLTHDPDAAGVAAEHDCGVVLMHMRGTPQTMKGLAVYRDVVAEVLGELRVVVEAAVAAGVARRRIAIDPGIGFAKTAEQNILILQNLEAFRALALPILVGVSRKSFIGMYGGEADPQRRGPGSLAAALFARCKGASIVRVHDVAETVQALKLWHTLSGSYN